MVWVKGVSGNPKGRPKGKTLKEFAHDLLMSMNDEEKRKYLSEIPKEIVWKMAEGNPANNTDLTTKGKELPTPIYGGISKHSSNEENLSVEKED